MNTVTGNTTVVQSSYTLQISMYADTHTHYTTQDSTGLWSQSLEFLNTSHYPTQHSYVSYLKEPSICVMMNSPSPLFSNPIRESIVSPAGNPNVIITN